MNCTASLTKSLQRLVSRIRMWRAGIPEHAALVSVLPGRLAVAPTRPLPLSVRDDDHERVTIQAERWQQTAGEASLWEAGSAPGSGNAYALAGQMASAGEQLALARAAGIEAAMWREFRENREFDTADEMSMRAMAEAQLLFVIGTGHALANVAVRALVLDPKLKTDLITRFTTRRATPTFDPTSDAPADWVSMNRPTCERIRAVASAAAQEVIDLVAPVVAIGTGRCWKDLVARRGEDFHRWRPQSHGMEGVPRTQPWTVQGNVWSIDVGHPNYADARGLANEAARLADAGMFELARSMEAFIDRWPSASCRLGGPRFAAPPGE
jgi:hypothetical protein